MGTRQALLARPVAASSASGSSASLGSSESCWADSWPSSQSSRRPRSRRIVQRSLRVAGARPSGPPRRKGGMVPARHQAVSTAGRHRVAAALCDIADVSFQRRRSPSGPTLVSTPRRRTSSAASGRHARGSAARRHAACRVERRVPDRREREAYWLSQFRIARVVSSGFSSWIQWPQSRLISSAFGTNVVRLADLGTGSRSP